MKRIHRDLSLVVLCCFAVCVGCNGSAIDPQADKVLRAMSDTLGGASALEFRGVGVMDEVLATGQLSQFTRTSQVVMRRPDKLHVATEGDDLSRLVWYDGETLTVLDRSDNAYASLAVPDSVEEMVDFVIAEYGLTVPVADLLFSNTYESLIANAQSGEYLGVHVTGDHQCHHLLFRQEQIDWQIWIDAGELALPRKLLIIYKTEPGMPRFFVRLDGWNLAAEPADELFEFTAPADGELIEMDDLLSTEEGE